MDPLIRGINLRRACPSGENQDGRSQQVLLHEIGLGDPTGSVAVAPPASVSVVRRKWRSGSRRSVGLMGDVPPATISPPRVQTWPSSAHQHATRHAACTHPTPPCHYRRRAWRLALAPAAAAKLLALAGCRWGRGEFRIWWPCSELCMARTLDHLKCCPRAHSALVSPARPPRGRTRVVDDNIHRLLCHPRSSCLPICRRLECAMPSGGVLPDR